MVAHGDEEFPAIVGVDNADLVGRGQIAATGKPAAGKHQANITLRDLHSDADGDQARLAGRKHDGRIQAGAQIGPGRILLPVCEAGEEKTMTVTKKDPLWKRARKIRWGERV